MEHLFLKQKTADDALVVENQVLALFERDRGRTPEGLFGKTGEALRQAEAFINIRGSEDPIQFPHAFHIARREWDDPEVHNKGERSSRVQRPLRTSVL